MIGKKINTREIRLSSDVLTLFRKTKEIWNRYPDLWLMGGGARDAFLNWLGDKREGYTRESISLRDLDLVYLGEEEEGQDIIRFFEQAGYQAPDLEYITSLDDFFSTRDNPLNEVVLRPEEMIVSEKALETGESKEIKPSYFEINEDYGDITPRLGLRLISLAIQEGWEDRIDPMVLEAIEAAQPFQLYQNLYKAFQKGIGDKFYQYIKSNPYLEGISNPDEALVRLDKLVYNFIKTPYQEAAFESAEKLNYFDRFNQEERKRKGKKIRKWREDNKINHLANFLIQKGFLKEAKILSQILITLDPNIFNR